MTTVFSHGKLQINCILYTFQWEIDWIFVVVVDVVMNIDHWASLQLCNLSWKFNAFNPLHENAWFEEEKYSNPRFILKFQSSCCSAWELFECSYRWIEIYSFDQWNFFLKNWLECWKLTHSMGIILDIQWKLNTFRWKIHFRDNRKQKSRKVSRSVENMMDLLWNKEIAVI